MAENKADSLTLQYSAQNIDRASDFIGDYFKDKNVDSKQIIRIRLSVEDCLSIWCTKAKEEDTFTLSVKNRISGYKVTITSQGEHLDPYMVKAKDNSELGNGMLVTLGLLPEYSRIRQNNRLTFTIKRKPLNPVVKILCIIAAAILIGFLMNTLLPEKAVKAFNESLLSPVYNAFLRLLQGSSGPMIFLSVAWGIYGVGDVITFGRVGKKMFGLYILVDAAVVLLATALIPLFGVHLSALGSQGGSFSAIFSLLLDIIPPDIFDPFITGNTLQIIFLAIIVGITLLFLGQRTESVAKAVGQFNILVQNLIQSISNLVPYVTFLVVLKMVLEHTLSVMSSSMKLFIFIIAGSYIAILLIFIVCGIILKANPLKLLKKSIPLLIIGLTTASSAAAFEINLDTTENKMGVKSSLASFGIPLGMVVCKVGCAVLYPLMCANFILIYNIQVSMQLLVTLIIASIFLTVATPPITGGGAIAYIALFSQVGIPAEALATALAVDVVIDYIATSACVTPLPVLLAIIAKRTGMLDEKKLYS